MYLDTNIYLDAWQKLCIQICQNKLQFGTDGVAYKPQKYLNMHDEASKVQFSFSETRTTEGKLVNSIQQATSFKQENKPFYI